MHMNLHQLDARIRKMLDNLKKITVRRSLRIDGIEYADRILMMKNGRIISSGTPEEMLTVEKLTDVYGIAPEITDFPVY